MSQESTTLPQGSIAALVDHVISRHHDYLREAFPRLEALSAEVVKAHGGQDPRLAQLDQSLRAFAQETSQHLDKEERILFPACVGLGAGRRPSMPPTVRMPISRMLQEHEGHLDELRRLAVLTDGFAARGDFGSSHEALVKGLRELDADLRLHIRTENETLFPWALRLEAGL